MLRARLAIAIAVLVGALAAPAVASADPVPGFGVEWPMCGSAPDDDGRYCIVSRTKNGSPIVVPPSGTYEDPYVQFVGFGSEPKSTVAFGVWLTDLDAGHQDTDVSPDDTYELVVNTGTVKPRELFGNVRNVSFSAGGGPPGGYTFTLSFKPTPVAWLEPFGSCQVGSCGDDTTTATFLRDGFVTGYVTNLVGSGLDADEIGFRTGYTRAYNADDAPMPFYDFDTHSLVVRLANPHLRSPGVPATGSYETFIPYAMLTGVMNVPSPATLTGGTVVVSRSASGSTSAVPFTLTHLPGGVRIEISSVTYSSPTYRIRPKRTRPGPPRLRSVARIAPRTVRVAFRRPLANGGARVTKYVARCVTARGRTFTASKAAPPVAVRVPRLKVSCSVRAVNRIGKGPFSAARKA